MKVGFPLSVHLYPSEDSQAADQQLQGVDVDGFAIFGPKAGQLEIQVEEEQLEPTHHLNSLMLSLLILLLDIYPVQLLASECKMKGSF